MDAKELNQEAKEIVEGLKSTLDDAKVVGERIKDNNDVFNVAFYLEMEDQLSNFFDNVVDAYMRVKNLLEFGMATMVTLLHIDYQNKHQKDAKTKVPGKDILENEAKIELKEVFEIETILAGREKVIRNYLATCRSHINALRGQQQEEDEQ